MKRKSIIDQIDEYCESATPDAIELLRQIVVRWSKKKPATKAAPVKARKAKPEVVEVRDVDKA